MNPTRLSWRPGPVRTSRGTLPSHARLLTGLLLLAGAVNATAATQYWNQASGNWSTSAADWSTTAVAAPSESWTNGNDASIVSSNPTIELWNVSAGAVNIADGVTLTANGTASAGRGMSITTGGSGDFTLLDNRTQGGTTMKVYLNGSTAWDGTITVNGSTTSTVAVVIGDNGVGAGSASTGVDTKIHLVDNGNLELGPATVGHTATIGELSGNGTIRFHGQYSTTAGTRTLLIDQATDTTFNGTVGADYTRANNNLAITKAGSGSLTITGGGAYEGATTVTGGRLFLNGSFGTGASFVTGQGDYIVQSGGLLGANGTFTLSSAATRNVTVQTGGILKPGTEGAAGTLTLAGGDGASVGLIFQDGATIEFRLGAAQDFIELQSASMIGSALGGDDSVLFDFLYNGSVLIGGTYDLISFGGSTQGIDLGAFTLGNDALLAGWDGTFGYGGDGNLLQFTVTSVPEPGAAALMTGAMGLGVLLRRKRSAS